MVEKFSAFGSFIWLRVCHEYPMAVVRAAWPRCILIYGGWPRRIIWVNNEVTQWKDVRRGSARPSELHQIGYY